MPRHTTKCEKVKARAAFAYRNAMDAEQLRRDAASLRTLCAGDKIRNSSFRSAQEWKRLMGLECERLAEEAEWAEIHWYVNVGPFDEVRR